jgi:hypothetical protein
VSLDPPDPELRRTTASYTLERELAVGIDRAFDAVVAEEVLPHVLHRVGPLPGVLGTRDLTGPWDTPGSRRTVELDGGRTVHETVLVWVRPLQFACRVEGFPKSIGWMADHAVGVWLFEPLGPRRSRLRWTYSFHSRALPTTPPLVVFARTFWGRYMEACADRLVERMTA